MRRNVIGCFLAGVAIAAAPAGVRAADVTVGAEAATAYVFRGYTLNDGPVVQPSLEVGGLPIPLSFGVWGNFDIDDHDGALESGEFSEIDLFASYDLPTVVEGLGWSVGYTEYTYPYGATADREANLAFGLEDLMLAPSLSINYGVDGAIEQSWYLEAGLSHSIDLAPVEWSFGAVLGYLEPDEGENGFSHYELSTSLGYGILTAGVAYIGQIDDDVLTDVRHGGGYDVRVVGTVGISQTF